MRFIAAIFANPVLKLAALFMAWAVWFLVDGNLTGERRITVDVTVLSDPGQFEVEVIGSSQLQINVAGPQRALAALPGRVDVEFTATLEADVNSREKTLDANKLDIDALRSDAELRVLDNNPSINYKVYRLETRTLALQPPGDLDEFGGHEARVTRVGYTSEVKVRGRTDGMPSASYDTRFDDADLRAAIKDVVGGSEIREIPLDVIGLENANAVFLEPKRLTMRVQIEKVKTDTVTVPISIVYAGGATRVLEFVATGVAGFIDEDPPKLQFTIRGPPGAFAGLDPTTLRAVVFEHEFEGESIGDAPVHVIGLPNGIHPPGDLEVNVRARSE